MIPGVDAKALENVDIDDRKMGRIEAIITSMTPYERENPGILNASRRIRIANGSGMRVQDVNQLVKQLEQMNQMMKNVNRGPLARKMKKKGKKKKK